MPASGSSTSFLDAAVTVLESVGHPLTANEIVAEAMARGILQPSGRTPIASMTARLYTHVRDAEHPRIVRVFEQGRTRALRDSVRWALAPTPPH